MSKQRINTSQAGFTLIEVGMGALILVVGFIGLIQAITIGTQMLDTARKQQVANQIIDTEIERLRAGSFATVSGLTGGTTYSVTVNADGTAVVGDAAQFSGLSANAAMMRQAKSFTCSLVKTNVRSNFNKIAYTITWTGNTGRIYSRTAEMFFGLNGLQLSYQKS